MSMFEKINKVVDERYLEGNHITLYDKDGVHLAEVIEPMLEAIMPTQALCLIHRLCSGR